MTASAALKARIAQNAAANGVAPAKPAEGVKKAAAPAKVDRYEGTNKSKAPADKPAPQLKADPALVKEARAKQVGAHLRGTSEARNEKPKSFTIERNDAKNTVIKTGSRDDVVNVRAVDKGRLEVDVNGEKTVLSKKQVAAGVVIDVGDGNNKVTIDANVKEGLGVRAGSGNDVIEGGSGDDKIFAGDGDNKVIGGKGDDLILTGKGKDAVLGGEGDDRISGGAGDDHLYGNEGHDKIIGGEGRDHVDGGSGDDYLEGNDGRDTLLGREGRDTMHGGKENDALYGGEGDDFVDGGKGNDLIEGNEGKDRLFGGQGDDEIRGGAERDVIAGGYGADTVDSGEGADKVFYEARDKGSDKDDQRINLELAADEAGTKPGRVVVGELPDPKDSEDSKKYKEEFNDRLEDDLDIMRSVPSGRELLNRLDNTIGAKKGYVFIDAEVGENDHKGDGSASIIRYDRTDHRWADNPKGWQKAPNVIGLYHEMVHSLQHAENRVPKGKTDGVKNVELDAVGLPYDHDNKKGTPKKEPAAGTPTENWFRADLEYEKRTEY